MVDYCFTGTTNILKKWFSNDTFLTPRCQWHCKVTILNFWCLLQMYISAKLDQYSKLLLYVYYMAGLRICSLVFTWIALFFRANHKRITILFQDQTSVYRPYCPWHRGVWLCCVHDTAEFDSAAPMILRTRSLAQRCLWNCGVNTI